MTKKLSVLACLMAGVMLFSACGKKDESGESGDNGGYEMARETMPTYLEEKGEYNIGFWVGIPEFKEVYDANGNGTGQTTAWTDEEFAEQYRLIKEAGFTIASTPVGLWSNDHTHRLLQAADDVGIKQLIWDEPMDAILKNEALSDEDAVSQARRILADYCDYESFYGSMITDEPQMTEYSGLAVGYKRYKQLLTDLELGEKMYYLNLFPYGATADQLGTNSYDAYLKEYEKIGLDYVCYDKYPLFNGTGGSTYLSDDFLYNMQLCQDMETNPRVWTFLQAMGFGIHKDPDCVEDFRIQANSALSYGMDGIQWFCYFSPYIGGSENFTPAIINTDGSRTVKYDMVKTVNLEVQALAGVYNQFTWERTINIIGTTNTRDENLAFNYFEDNDNTHKRIKSFVASQDTIAGVFKDGDGRDGFMVTNYDLPSSDAVDNVEITFYNCTKAVVVKNGVREVVDVTDGKVSVDLKASEGAFIIPLYI